MDERGVVEEAFSCREGLMYVIVGTLWVVSLFDAVNPGEDTAGGVGILRVVESCTRVGSTAELAEAGLPVDFKGAPVCVTPPFPSLGRIIVAVARVVDRDVSLAISPPLL